MDKILSSDGSMLYGMRFIMLFFMSTKWLSFAERLTRDTTH